MQYDSQLRRVTAPVSPGLVHYHLPIDGDGSAFHHVRLHRMSMAEHVHETVQISVALDDAVFVASAQSGGGRQSEHRVRAGQCYITPSHQPHGFFADHAGDLVNLYLSPRLFETHLGELCRGDVARLPELAVHDDPVLAHHAATLRTTLLRLRSCERIQVEAISIAVTEHLARRYLRERLPSLATTAKLSTGVVRGLLERVHDQLAGNLTVAELAAATPYSTVHFRRLFLNSTGYTPLEYIYGSRLHRAKALLRRTCLPVQEVAVASGFSTASHFIAQFRRREGTTPGVYRQAFRGAGGGRLHAR